MKVYKVVYEIGGQYYSSRTNEPTHQIHLRSGYSVAPSQYYVNRAIHRNDTTHGTPLFAFRDRLAALHFAEDQFNHCVVFLADAVPCEDQSDHWVVWSFTYDKFKGSTVFCDSIALIERVKPWAK
jgi:hypothetical protein